MELDVVLLPPKSLSAQLGGLILNLNKQVKLNIIVDGKKLLPHISLLHIEANAKAIPQINAALHKLAFGTKSFKVVFGKKNTAPGVFKAFLQVTILKSSKLSKLHADVVNQISPYRTGTVLLPPKLPNKLQKQYQKKYGAGNILKFFAPHFTLGRLKNLDDANKALKILSRKKLSPFIGKRIAVAKVDKHHQAVKILKEFKLK